MDNIFQSIPKHLKQEHIDVLVSNDNCRIQRILSQGQSSPPGFWYDQDEDEWVAVLKGNARISFQDETPPVELGPGDWLEIPAHQLHRVESTSEAEITVWLAVFSKR